MSAQGSVEDEAQLAIPERRGNKLLVVLVVTLGLALMAICAALAFFIGAASQKARRLEDRANHEKEALAVAQAALNTKQAEANSLGDQLAELRRDLTNSIAELRSAKDKLQTYQDEETERQRRASASAGAVRPVESRPSYQRIQVQEILHDYTYLHCRTSIGEILINGLPASVGKYLSDVKRMETEYASMLDDYERRDREARDANATALTGASGNAAYVAQAMEERRRANLMMEDVRNLGIQIAKYKANLNAWHNVAEEQTTILAYRTGTIYAAMQVWQYVGMAPKVSQQNP